MQKIKKNCIIITGQINQGKTTFTKELSEKLNNNGIKTGGFLAIGIIKKNEKKGYILRQLGGNSEKTIMDSNQQPGWKPLGRFFFDPAAFDWGNKIIEKDSLTNDIVIIDEVGPYEMKKKGWFDTVKELVKSNASIPLLVVRKNILDDFKQLFPEISLNIFDISQTNTNNACSKIVHLLKNTQSIFPE